MTGQGKTLAQELQDELGDDWITDLQSASAVSVLSRTKTLEEIPCSLWQQNHDKEDELEDEADWDEQVGPTEAAVQRSFTGTLTASGGHLAAEERSRTSKGKARTSLVRSFDLSARGKAGTAGRQRQGKPQVPAGASDGRSKAGAGRARGKSALPPMDKSGVSLPANSNGNGAGPGKESLARTRSGLTSVLPQLASAFARVGKVQGGRIRQLPANDVSKEDAADANPRGAKKGAMQADGWNALPVFYSSPLACGNLAVEAVDGAKDKKSKRRGTSTIPTVSELESTNFIDKPPEPRVKVGTKVRQAQRAEADDWNSIPISFSMPQHFALPQEAGKPEASHGALKDAGEVSCAVKQVGSHSGEFRLQKDLTDQHFPLHVARSCSSDKSAAGDVHVTPWVPSLDVTTQNSSPHGDPEAETGELRTEADQRSRPQGKFSPEGLGHVTVGGRATAWSPTVHGRLTPTKSPGAAAAQVKFLSSFEEHRRQVRAAEQREVVEAKELRAMSKHQRSHTRDRMDQRRGISGVRSGAYAGVMMQRSKTTARDAAWLHGCPESIWEEEEAGGGPLNSVAVSSLERYEQTQVDDCFSHLRIS